MGGNISNGLVDHQVGSRNHPTARGRKFNCSKCKSWHFPTRCPANGRKCYNCGEYDHFGRACTKPRNTPHRVDNIEQVQDININSVSNTKNMTTAINPVKPCPNSWVMGFNFHGYGKHEEEFQMVNCKIDTGAMANILPLLLFR